MIFNPAGGTSNLTRFERQVLDHVLEAFASEHNRSIIPPSDTSMASDLQIMDSALVPIICHGLRSVSIIPTGTTEVTSVSPALIALFVSSESGFKVHIISCGS